MPWTLKQREQILERAWGDSATCPDDHEVLQVRLAEMVGDDYRLQASCPKCGQHMTVGRGEDPRRTSFRRWTAEEIGAMVDSTLQGDVPQCPVCGAGVRIDETRHSTGIAVVLHCVRCGASAERDTASGR